jgi:hypothetical protein
MRFNPKLLWWPRCSPQSCRIPQIAARTRYCQPRLDALEDRCVPAYLVTTNGDDITQPGTLRYELAREQLARPTNWRVDPVLIGPGVSSITLLNGELLLKQSVAIATQGSQPVTISGNGSSRVFEIGPKATVTLHNLTVTGGNGVANNRFGNSTLDNSGGGILNEGRLIVGAADGSDHCMVTANIANGAGGGICNYLGTLTLNGAVSENSATSGGGIANLGGAVTVAGTVGNNWASDGGGIDNEDQNGRVGMLTISGGMLGGVLSGNNGGAIRNVDAKFPSIAVRCLPATALHRAAASITRRSSRLPPSRSATPPSPVTTPAGQAAESTTRSEAVHRIAAAGRIRVSQSH